MSIASLSSATPSLAQSLQGQTSATAQAAQQTRPHHHHAAAGDAAPQAAATATLASQSTPGTLAALDVSA